MASEISKEMSSAETSSMETSSPEAVLKIVSNRCRNLKKAIEKASLLELADKRGDTLNPEQHECIKAKAVRLALLHELEEILKKQSAVVLKDTDLKEEKLSKRAAKRLERERRIAAAKEREKSEPEQNETDSKDESAPASASDSASADCSRVVEEENEAKNADKDASSSTLSNEAEGTNASNGKYSVKTDYSPSSADHIGTIQAILEVSHVVDYINQEGGEDSVLRYFSSSPRIKTSRHVSRLDLDVLRYFNMMLTSPNGNVPHRDAVELSGVHCASYLEKSEKEAFPGTTYATLADIVRSIAESPLFVDRGRENTSDVSSVRDGKHVGENGSVSSGTARMADAKGLQADQSANPSAHIEDPTSLKALY